MIVLVWRLIARYVIGMHLVAPKCASYGCRHPRSRLCEQLFCRPHCGVNSCKCESPNRLSREEVELLAEYRKATKPRQIEGGA